MEKYQPHTLFTVAFKLPPGVTEAKACAYIKNALLTELSVLSPGDPMSELDLKSLTVTHRPMMMMP